MKQPYDISHLQDEHLDMMLHLAYALEDNDAVQHALSTPDPDLTPDEARLADEALLQAFARVKAAQRYPRLHHAAAVARKALPWVINTAACIILLLAMGSKAIFTFIFAMFIGLIAGTLSSIFIAPTVWRWARTKLRKDDGTKKPKKQAKNEALDEYTFKGINA